MFHVKPHFRLKFLLKILLLVIFFHITSSCFSREENKISIGVSSEYSFKNDYNNYASTIHLNYNIYGNVRMAPSFSYYLDKDNMKMRAFSFNFHYLMPQLITKISSAMKNQGICLYPLAGFYISSSSGSKKGCSSCITTYSASDSNFTHNFGFDFGAGAEYELPTLLPLLRDMYMVFEMKYFIVDRYSRSSVTCGLSYKF